MVGLNAQGIMLTLMAAGLTVTNQDFLKKNIQEIFDDTQQISISGNLQNISKMLDYHYLQKGHYPAENHFNQWLQKNFKEMHLDSEINTRLSYSVSPQRSKFILRSCGKDGLLGTEDDLQITGP